MLDMYGAIDPSNESRIPGGVTLVRAAEGGYTGPGGTWEEPEEPQETPLRMVTVQAASMKTLKFLEAQGNTASIEDIRVVYINDGTTLRTDDGERMADILRFSDGVAEREWRVVATDNRPWRNYCKATVERYRGGQ